LWCPALQQAICVCSGAMDPAAHVTTNDVSMPMMASAEITARGGDTTNSILVPGETPVNLLTAKTL
jgi:hypothetical protein